MTHIETRLWETHRVLVVPDTLSPSSIRTFSDCPQKWKLAYVDKIKEPPKWHLHLGNFVHEVLEHLYKLPADQRTVETVRTVAKERWEANGWETKVGGLAEMKGPISQFKHEAFDAITNLWAIENPTETTIDDMERRVKVAVDGVAMSGIIDRLQIESGTAVISDYKTGKIPDPKFPENSEANKFFQLLAYALMLESLDGTETSRVELLYLNHKARHPLDVTPARLAVARGKIVETREAIDSSAAVEDFHCNVTKLCDWCHYKGTGDCPAFAR
ncbi:MAG: PD-(D/E)XK nuclease family protein [Actinobacteria bacterium]|nr:PD-(D/E)XK nuclease family protein [Actinomycetota bacterium]